MINFNEFIEVSKLQKTGQGTTKEAAEFVRKNVGKYQGLDIEISFGKGRATHIPWIAYLGYGQKVLNGIYPVLLYYKDNNLLILCYGVSEKNTPNSNWDEIKEKQSIRQYFDYNNLSHPPKYGNSYVYKVYKSDKIDNKKVYTDLDSLINLYNDTLEILKPIIPLPDVPKKPIKGKETFRLIALMESIKKSNLLIGKTTLNRFVASILTKPFVILTGLSGSGKTKLAQAFAKWICADTNQYRIIPVGADWTNREPLLGYPNALENELYIMPDNGALQLVIDAAKPGNENKPYFLILDEMNLSHVERYFADFLSAMESNESIPLHNGSPDWKGVPSFVKLPQNLFIIGTVNIDETTYMFSPKVLDRASVIEFRVSEKEMEEYLDSNHYLNIDILAGLGSNQAADFVNLALDRSIQPADVMELNTSLLYFFTELQKTGAEFGYRSASEILRFVAVANKIDSGWKMDDIIDAAIMQKLLPKVHGSRKKLESTLQKIGEFCLTDKLPSDIKIETLLNPKENFIITQSIKYPLSFEKISRMYRNLLNNGFTSYAEA